MRKIIKFTTKIIEPIWNFKQQEIVIAVCDDGTLWQMSGLKPSSDEKANSFYFNVEAFDLTKKLNFKTSEWDLSTRTRNCLENERLEFIGELVQRTESDMLKVKFLGRKSLNELKYLLLDMGLCFGLEIDGWKKA